MPLAFSDKRFVRVRAAVDMRHYGRRGIGRYNVQLHNALLLHGGDRVSPTFFGNPDGHQGHWRSLRTKWYVTQEQIDLPLALGGRKYDVVHLTANTAPVIQFGWPPLVVTVHDIMYLKSPRAYPISRELRQLFGRMYRALAFITGTARASRFIVDSEQTATELRRTFRGRPRPIDVVYPAVDPAFLGSRDMNISDRVCLALGVRPGEFFLHPGALDPRKNTELVLSAFGQYVDDGGAFDLVVFGLQSRSPKYLHTLNSEARRRVHILPWISDDEVLALTQSAAAMVFVPRDEGFGFPLMEALAAKTPAIASSIQVLKEISEGHALWVGPNDGAELTRMLGRIGTRDPEIREMVIRGRARATQFSLKNMAEKTLASYERAAKSSAEIGLKRRR